KRVPELRRRPLRIPLAHTLHAVGESQICLIVKDPQRESEQRIQASGVQGITSVLAVTTLRNYFKAFEAKRRLLDAYDLFLADERVIPLLSRLLGSKFFQKKRQPIAVDLAKDDHIKG